MTTQDPAPPVLHVDGVAVVATGTLLDACAAAGRPVPTLCHDPRLPAGGHCRACLVEVDGRLVAACTTAAAPGAQIRTDTEALRAYREDLAELVLSEAHAAGPAAATLAGMRNAGTADGAGSTNIARPTGHRYAPIERTDGGPRRRADASHPYLRLDLDRCILCRLCVQACARVQGRFTLAVAGRGAEAHLAFGADRFADSTCVSCGACAAVCPADALADVDRRRAHEPAVAESDERAARTGPGSAETVVRTTCSYCGVGCQLDVHVAHDAVVRIDGAQSPVNHGHLCSKGRYSHGFARHPDRLRTPLLRRQGRLQPATWDEALGFVAAQLERLRGRLGFLSSSRCTNEENYLVQKWARAGFGTNNVDCCARVCHAPSAVGLRTSFGTGAATGSFADIEAADLFLVAGANPTEAHPVVGARLVQAVLGGARLVVIDPRRTELARLADVHLQLRPGSNVALLNALAAVLVEEGLIDRAFLAARVEGFEAYARFIAASAPERTQATTGVPAQLVRQAARLYGRAARPMQVHGLGMTEHHQGSEGVMLLANLALLVGGVGRPGTGVNPLRGQNNVQGAADMGCQPDLLTGYQDPRVTAVRERFARVWGRPVPATPGLTLPRLYEEIRAGSIAGLFILGEDVAQTDPDASQVIATLGQLELLVVQEIFLSETARLAHVVLPGASFLEKDGTFTNGERRIQRVRRALLPPGEARPDWQILQALMTATGLPTAYPDPAAIFAEVTALAPLFAGATYARLDGDGLQWPIPTADHPGTPRLHTTAFPRGKALLACVEQLPPASDPSGAPLVLITGRALAHYNSGSMTRRSPHLALLGSDRLQIHPDDARTRGITEGTPVVIESRFGQAHVVATVTDDVAPGTVFTTFHFPASTTNAVTSGVRDRLADCPEYKVTPVDVRRA